MDNLLEKRKDKFEQLRIRREQQRSSLSESNTEGSGAANPLKEIPELFVECPTCHKEFTKRHLRENLYVCPECGEYHFFKPENDLENPDVELVKCNWCKKQYDKNYPFCPECGHKREE